MTVLQKHKFVKRYHRTRKLIKFSSFIFLTAASIKSYGIDSEEIDCPFGCNDPEKNQSLYKIGENFEYCLKTTLAKAEFGDSGHHIRVYFGSDFLPRIGEIWWQNVSDVNKRIGYPIIWRHRREKPLCSINEFDDPHLRDRIFADPDMFSWSRKIHFFSLTHYVNSMIAFAELDFDIHWHYDYSIKYWRNSLEVAEKELQTVESLKSELNNQWSWEIDRRLRDLNKPEDLKFSIDRAKKKIEDLETLPERVSVLQDCREKNNKIFQQIYDRCIEQHQWRGAYHQRGLLYFQRGEYLEAFDNVSKFLRLAHAAGKTALITDTTYLEFGIIASELGLYQKAISSLSYAIRANPRNQDAYIERAISYFEMGDLDKALADYLLSGDLSTSDRSKLQWLEITQLSAGIAIGVLEGGTHGVVDFLPGVLGSIRGVGNGLWAFCTDPVGASQEFADAALHCVEYIKSHSSLEILQRMVPELQELIQNYDCLSDYQKGKLIGYVIGKYGIDIFLWSGSLKAVKYYQDLRRANQLMTLEALASPKNAQKILEEAGKRWTLREQVFENGNLRIQWDKQGKHIEGHRNYFPDKKKSILTHQNPDQLLKDFAGTGKKMRGDAPGAPGYKELVNFEEQIGFYVNPESGERIATSWGSIHYAKDGIHIVPEHPR